MSLARDERGLVGKLLVLTVLTVAMVLVLVVDAGAIVLARLRTGDLAQDASFAAAESFAETGSRRAALRAALKVVTDEESARLDDLEISGRGEVTVVVTTRASTLLAGRFGFLQDLTTTTSSDSSAPGG
jgi:hypothetical protein